MSVHEQYAEDLALYAIGVLLGDELAAVEKHLEECADCRHEVELLRGDASLLAYSTVNSVPPARSRQRLLNAVRHEPRRNEPQRNEPRRKETSLTRPWWNAVPWLAAAGMTILAALLMRQNSGLREKISSMQELNSQQESRLQQAKEVVATLTATDALRVTLVAAHTPPQPQGKAFYVRDRGSLIFMASNFKAAPAEKAYELWLIPAKGSPIAAGLFKPDAHGNATVINPPLPRGVEAKAFAITVESEAGSPMPTSPIILLGSGE